MGPDLAGVHAFEAVVALPDVREGARGSRQGGAGSAGCVWEVALARGSLSRGRSRVMQISSRGVDVGSRGLGGTFSPLSTGLLLCRIETTSSRFETTSSRFETTSQSASRKESQPQKKSQRGDGQAIALGPRAAQFQ